MFGPSGGARRCSQCSIDYPNLNAHKICEVCDGETSYFPNIDPDEQWEEAVRFARMHPDDIVSAPLDETGWRQRQYVEMGFTEPQAERLAEAKLGPNALPLYPGQVKEALEAGCDPLVAFDMFT